MSKLYSLLASLALFALILCGASLLTACGSILQDDTSQAVTTFVASLRAQIESGSFNADTMEMQLKAVAKTIPADKRPSAYSAIRAGVKAVCDYRVSQGKMGQADADSLLTKYDAAVIKVEAWIVGTEAKAAAAYQKQQKAVKTASLRGQIERMERDLSALKPFSREANCLDRRIDRVSCELTCVEGSLADLFPLSMAAEK